MLSAIFSRNCHSILQLKKGSLEASFYIDKYDVIEDVLLHGEGVSKAEKEVLVQLAKRLKKKKLDQVDYSDAASDFEATVLDFISLTLERYRNEVHLPVLFKDQFNSRQLVCRCQGIDQKELEQLVEKNYADISLILKNSMMAQVCGSCMPELKQACADSRHFQELYYGKSEEYWAKTINQELQDISKHLPANFHRISFEFISFKKGLLKLRCGGERAGISRTDIQNVTRHFLQGKLQVPLELSVVF